MKSSRILLIFVALLIITSCATVPKESVELNSQVGEGIETLHESYIKLLNKYFEDKRKAIDDFIEHTYLPRFVENIRTGLEEAGEDPDSFEASMISDITKEVIRKRDNMHEEIEKARIALHTRINNNFRLINRANDSITDLLKSLADLDEQLSLYSKSVKKVTKEKIDFDKMENVFDEFLIEAGSDSENAVNFYEQIKMLLERDNNE